VDGWVASIVAILEDPEERQNGQNFDPLNYKLVVLLLPNYLEELATLKEKRTELESRLAITKKQKDEEDAEEMTGEEDDEEQLSEEEIKTLKRELGEVKKTLNKRKDELIRRLEQARERLTTEQCQLLVLSIMQRDLEAQLNRYLIVHRRAVITAIENWWDKYRVTLQEIEGEQDESKMQLTEAWS